MPYALRHADGRVLSLHHEAQAGAEFLAPDHADVRAFLGAPAGGPQSEFARLDADVVRVLEDLIDVLIARQVLRITDLPEQAQQKLYARKSFRDRKPAQALELYGGDDGILPTDVAGP